MAKITIWFANKGQAITVEQAKNQVAINIKKLARREYHRAFQKLRSLAWANRYCGRN